jgi:hypothetical protein
MNIAAITTGTVTGISAAQTAELQRAAKSFRIMMEQHLSDPGFVKEADNMGNMFSWDEKLRTQLEAIATDMHPVQILALGLMLGKKTFESHGRRGGKARAANMTAAQRRKSALKASRAAAKARAARTTENLTGTQATAVAKKAGK